jgi:hypothetical protein
MTLQGVNMSKKILSLYTLFALTFINLSAVGSIQLDQAEKGGMTNVLACDCQNHKADKDKQEETLACNCKGHKKDKEESNNNSTGNLLACKHCD